MLIKRLTGANQLWTSTLRPRRWLLGILSFSHDRLLFNPELLGWIEGDDIVAVSAMRARASMPALEPGTQWMLSPFLLNE